MVSIVSAASKVSLARGRSGSEPGQRSVSGSQTIAGNLLVASLILADLFVRIPDEANLLWLTTALLQRVVPLPMIWTIVRGRRPRAGAEIWRTVGGPVLVAALAGISLAANLLAA